LRGKLVRVEVIAGSEQVEPFTLRLQFHQNGADRAEYLLKPYLHPSGSKDFFAFPVPADADNCEVTFRVANKTKKIHFESFRALLFAP